LVGGFPVHPGIIRFSIIFCAKISSIEYLRNLHLLLKRSTKKRREDAEGYALCTPVFSIPQMKADKLPGFLFYRFAGSHKGADEAYIDVFQLSANGWIASGEVR
jgi:hypothetical protein